VTGTLALSISGGEKNCHLFALWIPLPGSLRQEAAAGTRSLGCRMAHLSGV
jgi:hypothetical protein